MKILKWFGFWLKNARAASLPQSVMPAAAAVIVCIGEPGFSVLYAILAVIGVALLHLAFNLLDDRFDYISHQTGYRNTLERAGFRAYTAKCPYLTSGEATVKDLTAACAVFGLAGLLCGLVILIGRGLPILIVVIIMAFLGWFYSGKPLRLSYHGLGEPVIGMIFSPLNVCGVSLACIGSISGFFRHYLNDNQIITDPASYASAFGGECEPDAVLMDSGGQVIEEVKKAFSGIDWIACTAGVLISGALSIVMCLIALRRVSRFNLTDINKL